MEVGAVRANNMGVGLNYRPLDGDKIDVLPVSPGCPVEPRLMLDNHLGRLAAALRMQGLLAVVLIVYLYYTTHTMDKP